MRRSQRTGMLAAMVVLSLTGGNSVLAQVTLDPAWPENPRILGGEGGAWADDVSFDEAYSVQQTADGGYIVAGAHWREDERQRAYVAKLDSLGNLDRVWDPNPKILGDGHLAQSVQQTTDDGFIVAGSTYAFGDGHSDVYLIKLDSAGDVDPAWDPNPKTFGGEGGDEAHSVQQTSDGGYIVAGWTYSFGEGSTDVYLIKLDSAGNLDPAWDPNPKTFGGEDRDGANSVQETAAGGYIVAGTTSSFGAGGQDVYLLKLDVQGNLDPAWETNPRTFGGERNDGASSVRETADGGFIVAGGTHSFDTGASDVYVIKLDAQGDLDPAWNTNPRTFGVEGHLTTSSVQQTTDGGYVVAGTGGSFVAGGEDVYLIKLDSLGNLDPAWAPNPRAFEGEMRELAHSVQQTTDGGFVVAGTEFRYTLDEDETVFNVWILKLAPARHFLRGDCDGDGETSGTQDALDLLTANFLGEVEIPCLAACDANGDGSIRGVADALDMLTHNFLGGVTIPAPFPDCGAGQLWTDGPLGCDTELECN